MTVPEALAIAAQHHGRGRLAAAEVIYREILAADPRNANALHRLGVLAQQAGRNEPAVELIRRAISVVPVAPAFHSNLGVALAGLGRFTEAAAACRRALELQPDYAEAFNNLAAALREMGQLEEALAACRRALQLRPDYPQAQNNLSVTLRDKGRCEEAIAACRRAIELEPDYAEAHDNLGIALRDGGRLDEAIAAFRTALHLKPGDAKAYGNLGAALRDGGRLDEAVAALRMSIRLKPEDAGVRSNLVYSLHFDPNQDRRAIAAEHEGWNQRIAAPLAKFIQPHANDRSSERRLRIGYVSPDFRNHVVGLNLLPLFEHHARERHEVICYSGVVRADGLTERFRALADRWREILGVTDEEVAEQIRRDGVDILVDLSQHMAGNRLPLFARKPAPVQVSFAGYPAGTGLGTIENRISDRHLEGGCAAGADRAGERVIWIDTFWCYDPCGIGVKVNALPAQESGAVTFGSLNNFCKLNERVLALWARVLGQVGDSRLVILSPEGSHRQRTLDVLAREGVGAQRVEFVGPRARKAYFEIYHRLDLVLDTFPYNGHTTSLDALWMGVPVVSLAGALPVSRAGLSQLSNLGLPELVAQTEDDYVRIAVELAGDLPRMAELRATLRERMQRSSLMDAPRFARNVETAYREMWRAWCAQACSHPRP